MSHNSILSKVVRRLLPAIVAITAPGAASAQAVVVNTKDGRSIAYPAGQFTAMTPYIRSLSSTTYTQGVVAALQYEKAADMSVARAGHQTFASGEGFVVAGGHTSYAVPTASAEMWQDGRWKTVGMNSGHDTGFSVTLADGRIMIGGGYAERGGVGASTMTDIYDPATQTFSRGPAMTTARCNSKAIATSRGICVSGNLGGTDASYDFYNGTSFTAVGKPDGRYRPYLFTDSQGNIYPLSTIDNKGNKIALKKSNSGVTCLYGEKYDVAANKDYYYFYGAYTDYMPLTLPADIRSEQYHRTDRNGFLVLAKNDAGDYLLTEPCADGNTTYNHREFDIPSRHPVSNELIEWRGGVIANNTKHEAYLIGTSVAAGKYTLHIISYDYKEYYWTIASAGGFAYDLKTASWTLMADGRMVCSGGYDGSDMRRDVYIFTLPKAGAKSSSAETNYGIDIWKADGTSDRYMESELKNVTTCQPGEKPGGQQQTTTVAPTGGKASLENITIDMPAGTFSNEAEVTITEAEKGYVDGDDERSQFYKVKFGGGIRKDFKVAIRMPRLENDDLVCMQFAMMGWAPSLQQETLNYHYVDVTYEDGAYVAEIPAMEAPDDADEIEAYIGVTKCTPYNGAANARANAGGTGRTDFKLFNKMGNRKEATALLSKLEKWIPTALDKLNELGYSIPKDATINCYLLEKPDLVTRVQGGGSASGWCTRSYFDKKWATVYLNYSIYQFEAENEKLGTVIHELFHYYQQFYDPRSAPRMKQFAGGMPLILEEASSTWSERFDNAAVLTTPKNARDNLFVFIPCLNPIHKDVVAPPGSIFTWGERYGNVGYGAATLMEYLTRKCGNDVVLDMWKDRQTGDPSDVSGTIERASRKHGIDIFSQAGYLDFIENLGSMQVYPSLVFSDLVKDRAVHDTIGVTIREVKNAFPVYHTNYVYGYGALIEELDVVRNRLYEGGIKIGDVSSTGIIEQTTSGLTTWVYKDGLQIGVTTKGVPMKIDPKHLGPAGAYLYMVTIADDFKTTATLTSRIVSRAFPLNITQKNMIVPSSPGTRKVRLETNCYDLKFVTDADWLSCYWSITDTMLNVHHEVMPDNMEQRKAIIRIVVPGDSGIDVVLDEIEVTQTKACIDLSETEFNVDKEGGTKKVTITATNCENIKVSTTSNFLHPTLSGSTITVKDDPNTSYERREGSVKVSGTMPVTGIKVERFISFAQAAAPSPDEVNLYNDGWVEVEGLRVLIPGKTLKYGDYLHYRSADTQIEKVGSSRKEFSWDVNLYIDPKDNKSMRHYEFYSGSVSWLKNEYFEETDKDGNKKERQITTRCSYNLKNLQTKDGLDFKSWKYNEDENGVLADYVSDYSYEVTEDGKPVRTVTQDGIAGNRASTSSAWVSLKLADGVPYLEADCDSLSYEGADYFDYFTYSKNETVTDVEVTTSDDWLTVEKTYTSEYIGNYRLNISVNQSKATRIGYIYITGTLADGTKLTRTVVVTQIYDAAWDEDPTITEGQKAELPTQAVLDALQGAGMPLYLGNAPPKLNGVYEMEPLRTIYQTGGDTGSDDYVKSLVFSMSSNSSSTDKALMRYYSHLKTGQNSSADDYYCYLGGYGNSFTLSNIRTVDYEGLFSFTVVTVVSGTIEGNSIRNLHFASVELDDDGNIDSMSIGTDGDGTSTPTSWEPGADDF